MDYEQLLSNALQYERRIRDLYLSAMKTIDDHKGETIFKVLAEDEQSHIDFIEYSIDILRWQGEIDMTKLRSSIPSKSFFDDQIEKMKKKIPQQLLGDIKRVLNSALQLEIETTKFYEDAYEKTDGKVKEVFEKLVEIEKRHEEVVQIELDHVSNYGYWFNFMEIDLEHG